MLAARDLSLSGRLSQVSAVLRPGEITAIVGPNGAGKSSLLGCLAGLTVPDSGTVELGGTSLHRLAARQRAQSVGFLPQSPELAWDISVETLVMLGRLPWRSGGAEDRRAAEAALETMELADLRLRPVSRLSGGERARALMARVLAGEPRWILADEPLANLDLAHQQDLLRALRAQAVQGVGVVLVMHGLAEAMNHADRVLVLDRGALVADGAPEAVLGADTIRRVWGIEARWLGEPGQRALAI
ncbi:MAG: ABC transporter ATP-binding protein [Novosphingobium sp.]